MAGQTETLTNTLLSWIDAGRLNPGDVIDEAELVTEFAVSRTPVREAILQLEAMGLVRRPAQGCDCVPAKPGGISGDPRSSRQT